MKTMNVEVSCVNRSEGKKKTKHLKEWAGTADGLSIELNKNESDFLQKKKTLAKLYRTKYLKKMQQ